MTLRTMIALAAASIVLSGCSQSPQPKQATKPDALVNLSQQTQPQTFVLRGEVVIGHEARSIQPCNSSQQYWVHLPSGEFERAQKLMHEAYQPLYGELIGYLVPPPLDGFAADYDATFVVTQVNRLSVEAANACHRPAHPTQAMGNEPFWNAQLTQKYVEFRQPGSKTTQWARQSNNLSRSIREYQLDNGSLRLANQHCSDTMSGDIFSWQSTLTVDDKTFHGCAMLSNLDTSRRWVGEYRAQSTENQSFQVSLQLNDDHSATTRYHYQNGEPTRVEVGFWQQLNDKQVQVTMTHHQQQYLIAQRIFTLDGDGLVTKEEKIHDKIYPLHGGGLKLFNTELIPRNPDQHENVQ